MESVAVSFDESQQLGSWYPSLLGLAEYFRTLNPPNVKYCVHCLLAIFNFNPPLSVQARTHLQIGTVLASSRNVKNISLALSHLERALAITLSETCQNGEELKFEAMSLSAQLYQSQVVGAFLVIRRVKDVLVELHNPVASAWGQKQMFMFELLNGSRGHEGQFAEAKQFLRKALEQSLHSPFWHCRLLFQLVQCEMEEGDHDGAISTLTSGFEFATHRQSEYARLLFLLSKAMVLLIDRKLAEAQQIMSQANSVVEQWVPVQAHLKETIKVFYFLLDTWQYLLTGQVKTAKPALKQLQQTIQIITSAHTEGGELMNGNPIEMFQWLSRDHMCVLVYLVTVIHSMQAGHVDKAQKYTDKAILQIEKLRTTDAHPLLISFQVVLLEHITMCRLVTGHKSVAIRQIVEICHKCSLDRGVRSKHAFQIHTLLGLYAMSTNSMDHAEAQFKVALDSPDVELRSFVSLNLALLYLRMNRVAEFNSVLETLDPSNPSTVSHSLRASTFYIRGLQAFFQSRHSDAKRFLRESLRMANTEDLNRLTSCSLVLLGHAFLSLGNSQEALNMVNPAMQLATKIPDIHIQLWASAVLKDLYRILGNPQSEAESYRMHDSFSQTLLQDHFQSAQLPEHQLIQWTEGPCPFFQVSPPSTVQQQQNPW